MALVVHEPFAFRGRVLQRGDVLFGEDADEVTRTSEHARRCSAAPDHHFEHLRVAPPQPAVVRGVASEPKSKK